MRTLLLDADSFIYQAASANEYETQWSAWLWTLHADLDASITQFESTVEQLVEDTQADKVVMALTDTTNWRKTVMPSYKAKRIKTRKPVVYQPMREFAQEKYRTFMRPGLEGDDVIGILATHDHLIEGEKVIVSIDKDMKTVPGCHLRLDDESRSLRVISVEEADRYHMLQTLTGDPTDGYPGCPGIGKVKADALLVEGRVLTPSKRQVTRGARKGEWEIVWEPGEHGTSWQVILSAYAAAGLGEEAALQNARVARICRASDYDFEKKEVRLWNPAQ